MNAEVEGPSAPELASLIDLVATVTERDVRPVSGIIDRQGSVPVALTSTLTGTGIQDLVSELFGTSSGEVGRLSMLTVRTLATASPSVAITVGARHTGQIALAMSALSAGTRVDGLGAVAVVGREPGLVAREISDGTWRLEGTAECVVAGQDALHYVVLAETRGGDAVALLVDRNGAGLDVSPAEPRTGLRGAGLSRLHFYESAHQSVEHLGGFEIVRRVERHWRTVVAAAAIGTGESAMSEAKQYLAQRRQFGQPLDQFAGLRAMVGLTRARLDAASALVDKSAEAGHLNDPAAAAVGARAVLEATEVAVNAAVEALQLHGGYGYIQEFPIERILRDAVSLRGRAGGVRKLTFISAAQFLGGPASSSH